MPLARIITRTPKDAATAFDYLLSQGYTVETVSPGEFRVTPAELELNLEKCRPGQALARAKALVESQRGAGQIEPPAAPEPIPPQKPKIPVAYDIAGRPVEFADEEELDHRQESTGIGKALALLFTRVIAPVRDFRQRRARQHALKLEAELARQREEIKRKEERSRERLQLETERRQRQERELAERSRQEQIAAEKEAEDRRRIVAEKAAAEERARIEAERAAAVLAAQQEQARIDGAQQAAASREEHEAMIAAERGAAERQQIEPVKMPQPVSEVAVWQRLPHRRVQRAAPISARRRRAPIVISRRAIVTAIGASLILLLGFVAYANRSAVSPFSPGTLMNESVKQDTPFGAATVTPAPPSSAAATPGKTSKTRKPRPTHPSAKRLRSASQADPVAEDEVMVRHSQPGRSKSQPTTSTANLKRYSDAE